MSTFLALHFANRGWSGAGLALTGFGAGYITVRLFIAHWPDKFGGVRVAGFSLLVEILGQAVLWTADTAPLALIGALLTGIGFSLIFPSMGVEATRRVAPELRGQAVGNFIAFFDIAIGLGGPIAGLLVGHFGYGAAFGVGTIAAVASLAILPAVKAMGAHKKG
jgi:MFS family permease